MKKINSYNNIMNNEIGIRVNGNESAVNIAENISDEILEVLRNSKFNRYPDSNSKKLRKLYGELININSENIIAGNGSDEMISLILTAFIKRKDIVVTLNPDFGMYDFYTSLNGGIIKKYETEEDGSFSVNKFINFIRSFKANLIILSNPNNPTGHILSNDEIMMILDAFPQSIVVIDEAYYEFYGQTMIPNIENYKNLIITRTLSKAWGLAALRVGFLISNKYIVEKIKSYKVPYNLSQISQDIACIMLKHPEIVMKNIEGIIYERERLFKDLKEIEKKSSHIKFYKSKGNFIFARSSLKEKIKCEMENRGILIRCFNDNSFRISVGLPWENDMIVNSIQKVVFD